jgi:hypothetical protein
MLEQILPTPEGLVSCYLGPVPVLDLLQCVCASVPWQHQRECSGAF